MSNRLAVLAMGVLMSCGVTGSGRAFPWRPDRLPLLPALTEAGMNGDRCNTCHTAGGGTVRNPFGKDWEATYPGAEDFGLTAGVAFGPLALKDSDGDGFSNQEELAAGTHPGNGTSRPLRFTRDLGAGLNTLSVPLSPRVGFRAVDLLGVAGASAEYLVWWDPSAQRFRRVDRTTERGSAADVAVGGQTAFLVWMQAAARVVFVGRAWGESAVSLVPGLNFLALPRRPSGVARLSDLLGGEGLGVALAEEGGRFRAYLPAFGADSGTNVPLRGGHGYFIVSPDGGTRDLGGDGWSDE
jgi:hypothetical protein